MVFFSSTRTMDKMDTLNWNFVQILFRLCFSRSKLTIFDFIQANARWNTTSEQ